MLTQKELGIYKAWNTALVYLLERVPDKHYLCLLNSDDWFVDNYIEIIRKYNGKEFIAGACCAHYQNRTVIRKCRSLKMFPFYMPIIDPSLCIRASLYRKIGLYREKFKVAGDYDFSYRVYKNGNSLEIIKDVLVNVEMGGFASQNLRIASYEALEISREWNFNLLPELAFFYRFLSLPRFDFFDSI